MFHRFTYQIFSPPRFIVLPKAEIHFTFMAKDIAVSNGVFQQEEKMLHDELAKIMGVNIKTIDGEVKIKIPQFSDVNNYFRVKNKGMRKENNKRGDLYVFIEPKYPKQINPQEMALINALKVYR